MNNGLQIVTQGQLQKFTPGQVGLLKLIENCVKNNRPCSFEDVVLCYAKNVRKIYVEEKWQFVSMEFNDHRKKYEYVNHDVYAAFKNNSWIWTYKIRSLVKSWFVTTIGLLCLKGKLIVLPIIEIE
jgi:hypothetical protein